MISSQSEGLGKRALGIVKIYLGSPFSANQRCPRSVVVDPQWMGGISVLRKHGANCKVVTINVLLTFLGCDWLCLERHQFLNIFLSSCLLPSSHWFRLARGSATYGPRAVFSTRSHRSFCLVHFLRNPRLTSRNR